MPLNKLNPEEILVGFFIQLPFYFVIGLWVFPLALMSGILWAIGGAGMKSVRRFGVPLISCAFTGCWYALPFALLITSLGYGEKSWLWCFFYKFKSHKTADFCTRIITYLIYWLSFAFFL